MTNAQASPEPPMVLDGARVLEYAPFDAQMKAGGRASAVMGGVALDLVQVAGLALVEDLAKGNRYLLLCDDDWATLSAEPCGDLPAAKARGEELFPGSERLWRPFRDLTPAERKELETTREFLRDLMASEPDA
jgi:hypothetical protein